MLRFEIRHKRRAPSPTLPATMLTGKKDTQQHEKGVPMAKMRHIALIVPDPEASAKFFEQAFDLKRAGTARRGIYLSDGVINIALLKQEPHEKVGLYHFGMWVDDLDASEKKVLDAGGTYLEGKPTSPNSYYEAKYRDPIGIVFDLTHKGWVGATKDVEAKS
jgi:lactoylglutathione lyase